MVEPSVYELDAWAKLQKIRSRPISSASRAVTEKLGQGARAVSEQATVFVDSHPRTKSVVKRGSAAAARIGTGMKDGAQRAIDVVPDGAQTWVIEAGRSTATMVTRAARVGLSPQRVVKRHQARGHDVVRLLDVRSLDLEQVDRVHGRILGLMYPGVAASSGAVAALVITGGEITGTMSGGATAAPSGGAIAAASAADMGAVIALSSRAVGHIALLYGYDPEDPTEKLFIWSVLNVGTAMSASAKQAAMQDLSRLTQALFRGKTWQVLNESVLARAYVAFSKAFTTRATKQSLGKFVPVVGIIAGAGFNWATLESIVDAAEFAYRRRFLLDKYPSLANEPDVDFEKDRGDTDDETFSVVEQVADLVGHDPFTTEDQDPGNE
jgi:EcsC protein family